MKNIQHKHIVLMLGIALQLPWLLCAQNPTQQYWMLVGSSCSDLNLSSSVTLPAPYFTARNIIGTSYTATIPTGATLQLGCGNATGTTSAILAGAGGLKKIGTGIITLTADNTYTGNTEIIEGTLQIGNLGTTGTLGAGDVFMLASTSLLFSHLIPQTIVNNISGEGSVIYRPSTQLPIQYLLVAGGAGGTKGVTSSYYGVGGGAGQVLTGNTNLENGTTITVGSGGNGSTAMGAVGNVIAGTNSILGVLTSKGGGIGNGTTGGTSGSGKGGGTGAGGTRGAGGGGANANGNGANGGGGIASSITGVNTTYGTGGGSYNGTPAMAVSGTANTGNGGSGGSTQSNGGNGGSGVVIIAYENIYPDLIIDNTLTYTRDAITRAGYKIYKFTSGTGNISFPYIVEYSINGNNTYTGETTIDAGAKVTAGNDNAFGTGSITINTNGILNTNGFAITNTIVNNGGTVIP